MTIDTTHQADLATLQERAESLLALVKECRSDAAKVGEIIDFMEDDARAIHLRVTNIASAVALLEDVCR